MKRLALFIAILAVIPQAGNGSQNNVGLLSLGDVDSRSRRVVVSVDLVTDTRTGERITSAEMIQRLSSKRMILIGEEHTDDYSHGVQAIIIEKLIRSGRTPTIGLEMLPQTQQPCLDDFHNHEPVEDIVGACSWYDSWGHNWQYYKEIFLLAKAYRLPLRALNVPRRIVKAIGLGDGLPEGPEVRSYFPAGINFESDDHRLLVKTYFAGADFLHRTSDSEFSQLFRMQCAWDAGMAAAAEGAIEENSPKQLVVVLAGAGHVAYRLGIARQFARINAKEIATILPVPVTSDVTRYAAGYADFLWGVPVSHGTRYPALGASVSESASGRGPRVIQVSPGSPASLATLQLGDEVVAINDKPVASAAAFYRMIADFYWGESFSVDVLRSEMPIRLQVSFSRQ